MNDFESIGDNCEFGFVQRGLNIDSSSLLRWAFLDSVESTSVGIRSCFDGTFAFENLRPAGGGTMVRDVTAGVAFHTSMRSELRDGIWQFVHADAERRSIHADEMEKFAHLRQKFRRGLVKGDRVYVAKRNDGLTRQQAADLFAAIAAHGSGRLLFVTVADALHPPGSVTRVDTLVAHGRVDRFADYAQADDVSLPSWQAMLETATALFDGKKLPRSRHSRSDASLPSLEQGPPDDSPTLHAGCLAPRPMSHRDLKALKAVDEVLTRGIKLSEPAFPQPVLLRQDLPAELLDDQYFAAAYPGLPAISTRRTVEVFEIAQYFSATTLLAGVRLKRSWADHLNVASFDPGHVDMLRQMFAPSFYAQIVGCETYDPARLWEHYRTCGLPADVPFSPLFDSVYYRRQVIEHGMPPLRPGEPLALHWMRAGVDAGIVPTPAFDEPYYRATQVDLAGMEWSASLHYLTTGMHEGRPPTIWFDQGWYQSHGAKSAIEQYDHFIAIGMHQGRTPSALVERIMRLFGRDTVFTAEIYTTLLKASARWRGRVPAASIPLLMSLYVAQWHPAAPSPLDGFLTYLRDGVPAGLSPGPMFDEAVYRKRAATSGLPAFEPGEVAIVHWMRFGVAARIVPTERFDEAFYLAKHSDIGRAGIWGFEHFINYGVHEGRVATATPMFRLREGLAAKDMDIPVLPSFYRFWYAADFPDDPNLAGAEIPAAAQRRLEQLLRSDWLAEIFAQAQAADPDVGELGSITDFLLPPFQDPMALRHAAIRNRIPKTHYDSIVCVPWIRTGGADLVAGLLAKALLRVRPNETVLVLRTDQPHFERANWLPGGVDIVDISGLTAGTTTEHAEELLREICRGVTASRVFNVNSRLCWTTLRTYGRNLAATLKTYAYLFCWDLTPAGLRAGYPAEFYAETATNMTAFLTDTQYLKDELSAMYRLPDPMRDRIVPMFTPAQTSLRHPSIARLVQDEAAPRSRRLVLWAGRLDRQKRFDLVQNIARLMPDVEFRCWGAALLDAPPNLAELPDNIHMQGSFDSFDDLPLAEAGAWLFTALWEGMPTTIIELATRGMPIVASAVGGVPELIQPETGWPVPGDADAETYATILRTALDSPPEATRRAEALQRRVAAIYNETIYDGALDKLLAAEGTA